MPPGPPIGEREREILTAIVETFIATGEPVGSRTLARANREGLSPATIRNVMADLADAGFLEQPHTSAGRVPSTEAYRYYVEQLTGKARLSDDDENIIQESLQGVSDVQEFMERTSHVLSLISRNVGVAVAIRGAEERSGACLFFAAGRSEGAGGGGDEVRPGARPGAAAWIFRKRIWMLRRASSTRTSAAGPWKRCATELARRLEQERSEYDRLMASVEQLYRQGALAADDSAQTVFVEGAANLVAGEQDRERLQELLKTLEEKQKIVELAGRVSRCQAGSGAGGDWAR